MPGKLGLPEILVLLACAGFDPANWPIWARTGRRHQELQVSRKDGEQDPDKGLASPRLSSWSGFLLKHHALAASLHQRHR
jgi:hypothetical protein